MPVGNFVAYYRVSTQQQGKSGLGLSAQQASVKTYLNGGDWKLLAEFTEVETGKGSNALDRRPQLKLALERCKRQGAILVIAKLDRLARNVHFISGLIETGVEFVAVDMPNANKTMLQIYAVMAENERDQISARTKAALAQAKARGVVLGAAGARNLRPNTEARIVEADAFVARMRGVFDGFEMRKLSQRQMAAELNMLGVKTAKDGRWSLVQVQRAKNRLTALGANDS